MYRRLTYCPLKGVHSIDAINKEKDFPFTDPFKITKNYGYMPSHVTSNIRAQDSIFTIPCDPTKEFSHPNLSKIIIDKDVPVK